MIDKDFFTRTYSVALSSVDLLFIDEALQLLHSSELINGDKDRMECISDINKKIAGQVAEQRKDSFSPTI